jgi:opacity protein-like surface antigen
MRSLSVALLAGATIASAFSSAQAADPADLPPIMGPQPLGVVPVIQQVAPVPVIQDFGGGWYLRGDIGIGVQRFTEFEHVQTNSAFVWPASWRIEQREMGDVTTFGGGFGFQWNSWLRFDATAEYRAKTKFKAIGSFTEFCQGGGRCFDAYDGNHSAFVFMANGYIDLGTWMRLTPFIGAGVGVARHSFSGLTDVGFNSDGTSAFGYASNNDFSEWNFAWAIHAGVVYCLSDNFKLEVAYRYMNFGNVNTSMIDCASGGCSTGGGPRAFYTFREFDSQDIKLGMRWMLTPDVMPQPMYQPPLMRKG